MATDNNIINEKYTNNIDDRYKVVKLSRDYQLEKIDKARKKLPAYLKERRKAFAKELRDYVDDNSFEGELSTDEKKVPMASLIAHTFRPIIRTYGLSPKYSAAELDVVFEYFQKTYVDLNENYTWIPSVEDYCQLLGVSRATFNNWMNNSNDDQIREVCNKVLDWCTARTKDAAFSGAVSDRYSVFHQKSSNKQKDNDPQQTNVLIQSNNILSDDDYNALLKKFDNFN